VRFGRSEKLGQVGRFGDEASEPDTGNALELRSTTSKRVSSEMRGAVEEETA
jgi:hypothetical protein